MEGGGGGQSACLAVCSEEGSLSCLSLRLSRGIFTGSHLGMSDPFRLGIYMHINKHASKHAQHYVPGSRVGDLPKRRAKTQTFGTAVPIRWEGQHTEAAGCGGVCVSSVQSGGVI